MSLPWQIPLGCAPMFKRKSEAPQPSLLKHYCKLNINENPIEELKAGLMCDIGESNRDPESIQRLIAAGMTVAHIIMTDYDQETFFQTVQSIRQAIYKYSTELRYAYPLALIADAKRPEIITGILKGGPNDTVKVIKDGLLRLTNELSWRECGNSSCIYVDYDELTDLEEDDIVYIDSLTPGKIKLVVCDVGDNSVDCKVDIGGTIGAKMTVRFSVAPRKTENLSDVQGDSKISFTSTSTRVSVNDPEPEAFVSMKDQLKWAVASKVDGVLVPNAEIPKDIYQVKELLSEKGKQILIFACIESARGLENIDKILSIADGVYLDRSALSTDLPVEKIFIAQKIILSKCDDVGKPCICKIVLNEQIPIICTTDIANLVLGGAAVLALEMHYDSPLKKALSYSYGIRMAEECLAASAVICRYAERITWKPKIYGNMELMQSSLREPTKAICVSAVEIAKRSSAVVIICLTNSGRTAKILSQINPSCSVIAVTRNCHTARQLCFWKGVRAVHYFDVANDSFVSEVGSRIRAGLDYCKAKRIVCAGDAYVILTSSKRDVGYCDLVRLLYASARESILLNKSTIK